MTNQPLPISNPQTKLAKERNRIAADRTLLAWIRSSITLINFGFGLDQILRALYFNLETAANPALLIKLLNLALVGLGIFALIVAIFDYQGELGRLQQSKYRYSSRLTIGTMITPMLIFLALGAFLIIWADFT